MQQKKAFLIRFPLSVLQRHYARASQAHDAGMSGMERQARASHTYAFKE